MAENKILPWAQTGTANVLSDADYAADVASGGLYGDGVKTGQASSKQANKTWRQATAPGAGLGQFLVDNLGVDVTDSDTPSTFSTRIANAVLKLAQISPFNQAWATATGGYRKYAIVSDSSGNFWVSTADQNTTVPGANGAKWQSLFDGYATQAWASSEFVKNIGGNQNGIVAAAMDASGVPSFLSGTGNWYLVQLKGDYATNSSLNTETTNRTNADTTLQNNIASEATARANADTNLQNQINNRVQKTGDTMSGPLTITGPSTGLFINSNSNNKNVSDINDATINFALKNRFGCAASIGMREHVGQNFGIILSTFDGSSWYEFDLISQGENQGRMVSPAGVSALTSDLQNYVTAATYSNDFYTSDSRVINLAYGHRIQAFQTNVGNGTEAGTWVTFPQSFSGTPVFYCANSNGNNDINTDTDYWCYGATATGMYVRPRNHNGSANILVIGPK